MISQRALSVDSSGIRRVFDLAGQLKDPVNLSIGQPDFEPAEIIRRGAIEAVEGKKNGYTVTQGIQPLRDEIAGAYGISEQDDLSVFLTSGVSGGLMLAYLTLLDPGDEILIPDPFFCMYRDQALLLNAVPTYYDTHPDFKISVEELARRVTSRTKAILVSSPGNPTGATLTQSELDDVIDFAKSRGIWILYDEIYSAFCYDAPHASAFKRYEKTIILNGFSKSHGVPGWRIGYAIGPKEVVQQMLKLQQYSFVCAPSITQWGILAGMKMDFAAQLEEYRRKRDFIVGALKGVYNFVCPGGAFYLYPEAPGGGGQSFVERCIENNLLVVPGNVFSRKDSHFRISFSAPMLQLERGVEILLRLAR